MDDGLVEGFVPDLGGSDPLALLAAQLGSEDDFPTSQGEESVQDESIETETAAAAQEEPPTTEAPPTSIMSAIEEAYRLSCASKRIEALQSNVDLLKNIPVSLAKQVSTKNAPSGVAGGAVIDVAAAATRAANENQENSPPSAEHVAAFLDILIQPDAAGQLLLIDHLELSGVPLPSSVLSAVVHQAAALGPWWRLRSLALSGCNIDLTHLQNLTSPEAQSFLWHLERLDLSYNPCLGRDVAQGALRPLAQFTAPATMMMMRLWRGAPLKYLDISYTELSSSVLAVCSRTLRSYPLPSSTGGIGSPLHDGTRPNLQCLKLGPPGDGIWTDGLIAEIAALMEAAPALMVLELCGATRKERDALATAWQTVHEKRSNSNNNNTNSNTLAIQIAEVRPGVVRFAAGAATQQLLPIEHPPTKHSLPGPETPKPAIDSRAAATGSDLPHFLDDWNNVYGTDCGTAAAANDQPRKMVQDVLRPSVVAPRGSLLPPRRPYTSTEAGEGGSRPPRGDGAVPRRQRGGGSGSGKSRGASGRRDRLPAHHTTAAEYGMTSGGWDNDEERPVRQPRGTANPNPRKKRSSGGAGGPRPVRMYSGGNAEDELPAGGIDINSDDDGRPMEDSEEDSYYSDEDDMMDIDNGPGAGYYDDEEEEEQEEEERAGGGAPMGQGSLRQSGPTTGATGASGLPSTANAAPTQPIEQRFKIRDGEMDVDSKLGRLYRADAKAFYKSIPDPADQKAAKAAFNLWDSCAENAWDRHRWDRPSKTQNDEPHVLGQLNKLFDLARKYKHDLGFPFPKWVPGGGTEAFQAATKTIMPVPSVVQPTQPKPKTKVKPTSGSGEERKKSGPRLPLRNRMVDDGGRGRESDGEESDGQGDGFMVPDGPVSESESELEEEREVELIDLVGSGKKKTPQSNPFMLPESQSPVRPSAGGHHHKNRVLIADSDDDDDDDFGPNNTINASGGGGSGSGGRNKDSAAAREIARLSAWNWDSRKEEHPPNAAVYGLADGKRSRRQRFTASQIVEVLGTEEQLERVKKPHRKSMPSLLSGESDEEEEGDQLEKRQAVVYDSSSSDDDVPLAAQFSRFRTTPGSNEFGGGVGVVATGVTTTKATPSPPPPEVEPAAPTIEQSMITPGATGMVTSAVAAPPAQQQQQQQVPPPPSDPNSAEIAAALARALLGSLYKPRDDEREQQQEVVNPSLPCAIVVREEEEKVAAAAAAVPVASENHATAPSAPSGVRIGIVPDSQEDDDFY